MGENSHYDDFWISLDLHTCRKEIHMTGVHRYIRPASMFAMLAMFVVPVQRTGAQDIAPGTRVRITYDAHRTGVSRIIRGGTDQTLGTFQRRDSSGYVLHSGGRETTLPVAHIRRVEVSEGRFRNVAGGALIAAGGAAGGLLVMHFLLVAPLGGEVDGPIYPAIVAGSALVGAIAGYAFPQERWKRVDGQSR